MNVSLLNPEKCCGCGKCSVICPDNAISMIKDDMGVFFPHINDSLCSDCSLCYEECSFNNNFCIKNDNKDFYLTKHKDNSVRYNSRSGGAFTALSDEILLNGGSVYGCVLNENYDAVHMRAVTSEKRDLMRGSKYIQSDISGCYKLIEEDLKSGIWVMFTGTGCQVNAVKSYFKNFDTDKLLLVDIICYGVPGDKVFKDYINYIESINNSSVVYFNFRDKYKHDWDSHVESYTLENGKTEYSDIYAEFFGSTLINRESCFACPFKNCDRVGDITIGDAWGIKKNNSDFNDNKGVSIVKINTEKGAEIWDIISKNIKFRSVSQTDFLQPALTGNYDKPDNYNSFRDFYLFHGFYRAYNRFILNIEPKIAITTFVRAYNYGAVLQAYALNKTINSMGYDCETVDYYPDYFYNFYSMRSLYPFGRIPFRHKSRKPWIKRRKTAKKVEKRSERFDKFIRENIRLTPLTFHNLNELEQNLSFFDIFISGSDQVFNGELMEYDPVFYLNFKQANVSEKYSYAASFGELDISPEKYEFVRRSLSDFKFHCIREKDGKDKLKNICNTDSGLCCDPTFLLSSDDWKSIASDSKPAKPYIFVYAVSELDDFLETAKKLSVEKNLDVVYLPCMMKKSVFDNSDKKLNSLGFKTLLTASPSDYISLISNADYVLSNSFHGTLFSVLFHKKFVGVTDYKGNKNIRTENLLGLLSLNDRAFNGTTDNFDGFIDWDYVDKKIKEIRDLGINSLIKMLGE